MKNKILLERNGRWFTANAFDDIGLVATASGPAVNVAVDKCKARVSEAIEGEPEYEVMDMNL